MRTNKFCSTGLVMSLALFALSLTQTTCSRSLSADSAAWDGTLELAVDAELGKLHVFLRTTAGQGKMPDIGKAEDCSWHGFSSFLRKCLLCLSGPAWIHPMHRPFRPTAAANSPHPHPHPHQLGRLQRPAALDQWLTGAGAGHQ
ncbi:hypothetical protein V8C86DRAFT_2717195, partial [Haematococcus lacustris]